ncbi:hypothetical protein [Ramlibacter pallidus]|uniref:Secreted protein n=1 Tax=Ramlibacter pallidus TaxID=2780087 RepID=A0ABR9S185_9BURK|nr:hypothetical protein [Ramlibacter pallidus]MBE7367286.1 hypothetical protein [Ramlibacter pallidus]
MKTKMKAIAAAVGTVMLFAAQQAAAESTYGYETNALNPVTATSRVTITVTTPKLILLRVGVPGATWQTVNLGLTPDVQTAPGPLPTTVGNSQAATWDGNAPVFTANTVNVNAFLWHNNNGNAQLTCVVGTPFPTLAASAVTVSSLAGGLQHPGSDTTCATPTTGLARNTVHTGTWTYGVSAAALTSAMPGSESQTVTYIATTL